MCSNCAGNYEDPDRTAAPTEEELRDDAERQAELDHDLPPGWHRSLYGRGLYYQEPK